MTKDGWKRRDFLGAAALVALAVAVPTGSVLSKLDKNDAPSDHQHALMRAVSDHVIPATQTPGAAATGVGEFVIVALAHGLEGARKPVASEAQSADLKPFLRKDASLRHLDWLEKTLDGAAEGDWLGKPAREREKSLAALDAAAFAPGADAHPWRTVKGLILTGYYTSEVGASKELQYELTPGSFDPRVPLAPHARAFSSDWTAVDFG